MIIIRMHRAHFELCSHRDTGKLLGHIVTTVQELVCKKNIVASVCGGVGNVVIVVIVDDDDDTHSMQCHAIFYNTFSLCLFLACIFITAYIIYYCSFFRLALFFCFAVRVSGVTV